MSRTPVNWERAQWDRRSSCSCGHAYRDHATGGTHCLGASLDSEQVTGTECGCFAWGPLDPRPRKSRAAKPEPGLDALTQAVTDALAVTGYVLIDETSGLPGTEPAFARALASRLTPDTGANR